MNLKYYSGEEPKLFDIIIHKESGINILNKKIVVEIYNQDKEITCYFQFNMSNRCLICRDKNNFKHRKYISGLINPSNYILIARAD